MSIAQTTASSMLVTCMCWGNWGGPGKKGLPQHYSSSEASVTAVTLYREKVAFPGLQMTTRRTINKP